MNMISELLLQLVVVLLQFELLLLQLEEHQLLLSGIHRRHEADLLLGGQGASTGS